MLVSLTSLTLDGSYSFVVRYLSDIHRGTRRQGVILCMATLTLVRNYPSESQHIPLGPCFLATIRPTDCTDS